MVCRCHARNAAVSKRAPISAQRVAQLVSAAAKYRNIDAGLVLTICTAEAPKASNEADAVKRVKRKLHQLVGAYVDTRLPFQSWLDQLSGTTDEAGRLELCRDILSHHASSRERWLELIDFYREIFAGVPQPRRIADLACGLNPLARGLMPIPRECEYFACDVDRPLVEFVAVAVRLLGFPIRTSVCNLLAELPSFEADIVLLLKTLPCLEQADKNAGRRLLETIEAPLVVVSYPTASLGGARRGMDKFYEAHFRQIVPSQKFEIETRHFRSELVFRLWRRPLAPPSVGASEAG